MKKFTPLSLLLALIFIIPLAARAQDTNKLDYPSLLKILEQLRGQKAVPSVIVSPVDSIFKPVNVPVVFKLGDTGEEVSKLQQKLRNAGYFLYPQITGYYGKVTDDAVKKYEARTKEKILRPVDWGETVVVSPNGGEVWLAGETYEIFYNTQPPKPTDINVYLDQYHPKGSPKFGGTNGIRLIAGSDGYPQVAGPNSLPFLVPEWATVQDDVNDGDYLYKIRVCAGDWCDSSDNFFVITSKKAGEGIKAKPLLNSQFGIMASVPSSGAVDARMPSNPDGSVVSGWQTFELVFNEYNAAKMKGLKPNDFVVKSTGTGVLKVSSVEVLGENNIRVKLDKPIPVGQWTLIVHEDSGTYAHFGFLPADSNGDGVVNSTDLLLLIDVNNQTEKAQDWQVDIDRNGIVNILDQLLWINLINGADAFDVWLNKSLPPLYGN